MSNGQGCTCNAWAANECACDADWTPQEVYDLRAENERLKAENKLYAAEMSAAKEDGFYSAQDLYSSYVGAEERVNTLESELAACREDAERWKYARRKMCLTGNGDGTCMMHGINFPADIPGWPEPGKVEEFCDAAIDSARAKEGGSE